MTVDNLIPLSVIRTVAAVGLHKIAGEMTGGGEMTAVKAASIIGARAYARRKTAKLVADGIVSLATVEKVAMSPEAAARLRRSLSPVPGSGG